MKEIRCAYASDVGRERDHNEDSYLADPGIGFFIIVDGMGGHEGGEVASALVVKSVGKDVSNGVAVDEALRRAHHRIFEAVENGQGKPGMGATAVALKLDDADFAVTWVGDSRAYLWDGSLTRISHDHSYVQKMMDAGAITEEEARNHPERSTILQALGAEDMPEIEPETVTGRLYRDQKILLCSDGLSSELEDDAIAAIMGQGLSEQDCISALIRAANDHGGEDNITVILVTSPLDASETPRKGGTRPMDIRKMALSTPKTKKSKAFYRAAMFVALLLVAFLGYCGYHTFIKKPTLKLPVVPVSPAPVAVPAKNRPIHHTQTIVKKDVKQKAAAAALLKKANTTQLHPSTPNASKTAKDKAISANAGAGK